MDRMLSYSKTAMERAMKVQGVISRAEAKKITRWVGSRKNGGRDGAVGDELKPGISFATKRGHF